MAKSNRPESEFTENNQSTQSKTASRTRVLLLGFGDVNQRLAQLLHGKNYEVYAARRSPLDAQGLSQKIHFQQSDITDADQLATLICKSPDQIVITIAPSNYSEQGYRDSYLKAVKTLLTVCDQQNAQPEILFVSSSSVYGQNNGEKIDEKSECLPSRYNGQILLEAETVLTQSALTTTVVRFAGIYGEGRHRLIGMCLKQEQDSQQHQIHWTNRINAEDCARVIEHLLALPAEKRQSLYLASDNLPVERHRVYNWIRKQFQLEKLNEPKASDPTIPVTGKRCDNSRLLASGFEFNYPTYKEGFIPVIEEYLEQNE